MAASCGRYRAVFRAAVNLNLTLHVPSGAMAVELAPDGLWNRHNFCPRSAPPRFPARHRPYHTSPRLLLSRKQLATMEGAHQFLSSLSPTQRTNLGVALNNLPTTAQQEQQTESQPPSWQQLRLLCYQNMLPFIGFGFLDNFIMITVADRIEETMGVVLCLSTMAAAGMGNMVSDLAGLGLADQVDSLCRFLGIPDPKLSSRQLTHTASRWMSLLGRCVGIIIGCIIGMCPLLWIHHRDHKQHDQK